MNDFIAFGIIVGILLTGYGLGQLSILVFGPNLLGLLAAAVFCGGFGLLAGHYGPMIAEWIARRKD